MSKNFPHDVTEQRKRKGRRTKNNKENPLKYTEDKKQNQLFAFNRVKNISFLPCRERAVLSFYAENYNWESKVASHWSQEKMCDLLGFKSEKTLRSCNKTLEELQWISIEKKFATTTADFQSVFAQIHIGIDDPNTLEVHKQNLIKQIEKDSDIPEHQKQRDIEFIRRHGRHETEFQDLASAKENFKKYHQDIYSREDFLSERESNSKNESEFTY